MAQRGRGQKPAYQTGIARERMEILLRMAKKEACRNPDRSRRYAMLARKIGMRYNVRLPGEWKRVFCKGCGTLLGRGRGATIIKCGKCNRIYRCPPRRKPKVG